MNRGDRFHKAHSPRIWANPTHVLAFGFGAGLFPIAPGSAGALVGIVCYAALEPLPMLWYLATTVFLFAIGIWLCGSTARDLGVHDHPGIVWDEIVGLLITMSAAPCGWGWTVLGFILFRAFDITKPWPIATIDRRVTGGLGIMLDDLLAGVYALAALQGIAFALKMVAL